MSELNNEYRKRNEYEYKTTKNGITPLKMAALTAWTQMN